MSNVAQPCHPSGTDGLTRYLTEDELANAPILESIDELLMGDLTDDETFFAALDT